MKISKEQLSKIIQEELRRALKEATRLDPGPKKPPAGYENCLVKKIDFSSTAFGRKKSTRKVSKEDIYGGWDSINADANPAAWSAYKYIGSIRAHFFDDKFNNDQSTEWDVWRVNHAGHELVCGSIGGVVEECQRLGIATDMLLAFIFAGLRSGATYFSKHGGCMRRAQDTPEIVQVYEKMVRLGFLYGEEKLFTHREGYSDTWDITGYRIKVSQEDIVKYFNEKRIWLNKFKKIKPLSNANNVIKQIQDSIYEEYLAQKAAISKKRSDLDEWFVDRQARKAAHDKFTKVF